MAHPRSFSNSIFNCVIVIAMSLVGTGCAFASPQYPSTEAVDVKDVLEVERESASIFEVDAAESEPVVTLSIDQAPAESGPFETLPIQEPEQEWTQDPPDQTVQSWQPPTQWTPPASTPLAVSNQFEVLTTTPMQPEVGRYPLLETTPTPTNTLPTTLTTPSHQAQFVIPQQTTNQRFANSVVPAISEPLSVGHRRPWPIKRANVAPLDDGEKFEYEKKKRDYPPFSEIIATGRFFYSAELLWGEPQFQGNNAFNVEGTNFGQAFPFDFDSDFHPKVRLGFESKYGPGIELSYFNLNSNSELSDFTSDGALVAHANAWVLGRNVWSRIFADDPGETLVAQHSIDIDSATVSFFKELKFPISRINGNFGFQYVSIAQELNANVNDAGGGSVESLRSVTDMRAFGPRVILEYYRPVGHTPLEFITAFGGSVLFGQRDQFVTNSQTGLQNRVGADEFITILDFMAGLQYTKTIGENRSWFARLGFVNQTWLGGGTAVLPQGDFGVRGLSFGIGYNR